MQDSAYAHGKLHPGTDTTITRRRNEMERLLQVQLRVVSREQALDIGRGRIKNPDPLRDRRIKNSDPLRDRRIKDSDPLAFGRRGITHHPARMNARHASANYARRKTRQPSSSSR